MSEQCTEERFLKDAATHKMEVLRNDGVNRHLRFRKPGGDSFYWFDLITWPGSLCINGDMGTYVFARLPDMFEFFRTDADYAKRKGKKLGVNPGYWGEKLTSIAKHGGYRKFSQELFAAAVKDYFDSHFQEEVEAGAQLLKEAAEAGTQLDADNLNELAEQEQVRKEIWERIECDVLNEYDKHGAFTALHDFCHEGFMFSDFEASCEDYSFHFIWCCYAIAWGIEQFDLATAPKEAS